MNNKLLSCVLFALVPAVGGCQTLLEPPLRQLTVKGVEETGRSISNAQVPAWSYWEPGGKIKGFTDINGLFRYEDRVYWEIGYSVRKAGYYNSLGTAWRTQEFSQVPETNLVVVLKRMVNPVHMIRRSINSDVPATKEEVFFDLAVGDWVAPHGKGKVPDISFAWSLQFETRSNFKVQLSGTFCDPLCGYLRFSGPQRADHSVLSALMPPHTAPTDGYEKTLPLYLSHNPEEWTRTHEKPDNNYIFQTRVVTNAVGKLVSANYAWTVGEIKVDTNDGKRPWIGFTYYYNPDPNSRSLEPKEIADQQAKDIPLLEQ